MLLEGKSIVVTGGNTGIGKAIVLAAAAEGANVVVNYVMHPKYTAEVTTAAGRAGGCAVGVEADVSRTDDLRRLIQTAVAEFGRLDVLVSNAGIETRTSLLETSEADFDKVLAVNLKGAFFGAQFAAHQFVAQRSGGVRNWDYRYCWLRDATYTLQALLAAGYRSEAGVWRDWLLRSMAGQPETLQILYSLDGARRLPEAGLPWLSGYEGSSPVRTGNAASGQLQLDVWGETLDALFLARQAGLPADRDAWALQVALMNYLESAWREPDNGLWEVRGDRRGGPPTPRSWPGSPPTGWHDRSAPTASPALRRGGNSSATRSITTS